MLPGDLKGRAAPYFLRSKKKRKPNKFLQENEIRDNAPSIAPSKINRPNFGKGCTGAMDRYPDKSRDLPFCRRRWDRLI